MPKRKVVLTGAAGYVAGRMLPALFRFSPGNLAYVPHNWSEDMLALMTDEQRKVLEPPYHARLDRPVLEV